MDLPHSLEFDLWLRYVDSLPAQGIPSYLTFDARLGWRPFEGLELSVVGQNLWDPQHPEMKPEVFVPMPALEVERGVYGKVTWKF
jgi:iron complex outermembrane receptor protein